MHIYRQIHVYAHIYLPEGVGMEMKLLRCCSPNINRVKSRFGALQAQEEFAAAAQPLWDLCWLDFSALGLLGRCYNCGLYKNAWKGFFAKLEGEKWKRWGDEMRWTAISRQNHGLFRLEKLSRTSPTLRPTFPGPPLTPHFWTLQGCWSHHRPGQCSKTLPV